MTSQAGLVILTGLVRRVSLRQVEQRLCINLPPYQVETEGGGWREGGRDSSGCASASLPTRSVLPSQVGRQAPLASPPQSGGEAASQMGEAGSQVGGQAVRWGRQPVRWGRQPVRWGGSQSDGEAGSQVGRQAPPGQARPGQNK